MKNEKYNRIAKRKKRVSLNIVGTDKRPRISVFRSNRYIYAQAIDDIKRVTVASASGLSDTKESKKINKVNQAKEVGRKLAANLKKIKITQAIFDRSIYSYLGRVKAVAEGLREENIKI